ncbi:MAG: nucleotide exchange factor GrpE [Planctomycetes bacterium]|nr:nucleotide exchange factor GrpE [Planctomycetota bacterium]
MNDDFAMNTPEERAVHTLGSSTLYNLLEAMIQLSERNQREHKLFTKDLKDVREAMQSSFNNFADLTQKAYQQLRKEVHGEKRVSLVLLNELLEVGQDFHEVTVARPRIHASMTPEEVEAVVRWADAVEVQSRKVEAAMTRHGIHPYDAVIGAPYDPKLHERVGTKRVEGMGPLLVAEQRQRGYASAQPEFVLRRPQVYVTE